jgi:hypothetical protein
MLKSKRIFNKCMGHWGIIFSFLSLQLIFKTHSNTVKYLVSYVQDVQRNACMADVSLIVVCF